MALHLVRPALPRRRRPRHPTTPLPPPPQQAVHDGSRASEHGLVSLQPLATIRNNTDAPIRLPDMQGTKGKILLGPVQADKSTGSSSSDPIAYRLYRLNAMKRPGPVPTASAFYLLAAGLQCATSLTSAQAPCRSSRRRLNRTLRHHRVSAVDVKPANLASSRTGSPQSLCCMCRVPRCAERVFAGSAVVHSMHRNGDGMQVPS